MRGLSALGALVTSHTLYGLITQSIMKDRNNMNWEQAFVELLDMYLGFIKKTGSANLAGFSSAHTSFQISQIQANGDSG